MRDRGAGTERAGKADRDETSMRVSRVFVSSPGGMADERAPARQGSGRPEAPLEGCGSHRLSTKHLREALRPPPALA